MKIVARLAVLLLLALPVTVLALGTESFGNAPVANQPDWAVGVVDVANSKARVYSQWVNGNENFFFRGNAQALNEAIAKFVAVKDKVRELVLLPGTGETHTFDRKPIAFDWQLHVPSGIYKAVAKKDHAVLTVYINGTKPREVANRKVVENWLRDLDDPAFTVREKAMQELEKQGNDAKPLLRAALKAQPGLETRRRMEKLLEKLRSFDVTDLEIPSGITVIGVERLLAIHLKGLNDPDPHVASQSIYELSRLILFNDDVMPSLTDMLKKDKNEYLRRVTASCLARVGVLAKPALPS